MHRREYWGAWVIYAFARRILPRKWRAMLKRLAGTKANPDEIGLVWDVLREVRNGQMVDVGAHYGGASWPFLEGGWRVLAFEPDDANRKRMAAELGRFPGLTMDTRAVSDRIAEGLDFYTSEISTGISSLHRFHGSHAPGRKVSVTTLDQALAEHGIRSIDFLKIDVEGHDLFAIRGLDASMPVRVIMAEFEDRKTHTLGYTAVDLAHCLQVRGFIVVASIWHPIVEYGRRHSWRKFARFPCEIGPAEWGNFIAFSRREDLERFEAVARRWFK